MSVRNKALVSMTLLILTICGIFLLMIYRQGEQGMEQLLESRVTAARQVAGSLVAQTANQYQRRIKSFINYKVSPTRAKILKAFAERDQEELYRLSKPFLETLQKENPYFKSIAWVLPDNMVFLKVHNFDKNLSNVSNCRYDVAAVNLEHVQHSGFTASPDEPQFRVVQPVFYQGEYVGALQMGISSSFLITTLQQKLQLFTALSTPNVEYAKWGKVNTALAKNTTHTFFSSNPKLLTDIVDIIDWNVFHQKFDWNERTYILHKILQLKDFRGEPFSCLFVAIDITEITAATQKKLCAAVGLSLFMLLVAGIIFHYGFGSLLAQIVGLNRSLEKTNLELEDQVIERTRELVAEIEERKNAEDKLHRAEKMEAIGLMASGVAHDLNNILAGMVSYPELLLMRLPADSKLRGPITAIKESGLRAAAVVADLLTVARGAAKVRTQVDINQLITNYLEFPEVTTLQQEHPDITLTTALDADLPLVCCSPTHVNKCIINLVNNGAEALTAGGNVNIGSSLQTLPCSSFSAVDLPAGDYVVLTVKDNGSGIAAEDLEHIFEPFYTKKKMGRSGTGIGLAVVWNCMIDHGGAVLVSSDDQQGTQFSLLFPLGSDVEKCTAIDGDNDTTYQVSGETVLVVDDEAQLRDIAVKILTTLGYKANAVSSGEAAIDYVKGQPVDLLLLDMVMEPGIGGSETFAEIVKLSPQQKAVIVSGYADSKQLEKTLNLGAASFLKKPYTMKQLQAAVGGALSR